MTTNLQHKVGPRVSKFSPNYEHPLHYKSAVPETDASLLSSKPLARTAFLTRPAASTAPASFGVKRNRSPSPSAVRERDREREKERERERREREREKASISAMKTGGGAAATAGRERERDRSASNTRASRGRAVSSSPGAGDIPIRIREKDRAGQRHKSWNSTSEMCAALPISDQIEEYGLPSIPKYCHVLSTLDIYGRFPNIYLPDDFVKMNVDWSSISMALDEDLLPKMVANAPILFETTPGTLSNEYVNSVGADYQPKPTNLKVNTVNNTISEVAHRPDLFVNATKPVKFNAKVIICCGFRDPEKDRVDCNLTRNLRILCGRRKGSVMLLGGAWCKELDGGNPLVDRSCLLNTARRAVYSQSLLDIFVGTNLFDCGSTFDQSIDSNLIKLCEISYHRPKEDTKGKTYPEQEEITAIYLYTISNSILMGEQAEELFDTQWGIFNDRVSGARMGPVLHKPVATNWAEYVSAEQQLNNAIETTIVAEENPMKLEVEPLDVSTNEGKDAEVVNGSNEEATIESTVLPATSLEKVVEDAKNIEYSNSAEPAMDFVIDTTPAADNLAMLTSDTSTTAEDNLSSRPTTSEGPETSETAVPVVGDVSAIENSAVVAPNAEEVTKPDKKKAKPAFPHVLLCPMPLSRLASEDISKKQEAVSLRILPLNTILTYSKDDCSERIFEASIAGEIVKSLLCTSNANIVADFLLANCPSLTYLADKRVLAATLKLREMAVSAKAKGSQNVTVAIVPPPIAAAVSAATVSDVDAGEPVEMSTTPGLSGEEPVVAEAENIQSTETVEIVKDGEKMTEETTMASPEGTGAETNEQTPMVIADGSVLDDAFKSDDAREDEMSEDIARMWRRRFLGACRWFDQRQDRSLFTEQLELILYASSRNISRIDVANCVSSAIKENKLRYEIFI